MSEPANKKATYEDLYEIPENMIGEVVNGKLVALPRPSMEHTYAASALDKRIGTPYQFAEGGGPGGWIILLEPESQLGEHTLVPDLAGWKRERFPFAEKSNWLSVAPDWVCEILSPRTALLDRTEKREIYAQAEVGHLWLVDPHNMTVELYRLGARAFHPSGVYGGEEKARLEPFTEIEINLADLWLNLLQR